MKKNLLSFIAIFSLLLLFSGASIAQSSSTNNTVVKSVPLSKAEKKERAIAEEKIRREKIEQASLKAEPTVNIVTKTQSHTSSDPVRAAIAAKYGNDEQQIADVQIKIASLNAEGKKVVTQKEYNLIKEKLDKRKGDFSTETINNKLSVYRILETL